jgi:hypothetical protein
LSAVTGGNEVIAVYVSPEAMSFEQYQRIQSKLEAAGAPTAGRKHHSCFGEAGHLAVFDIWESQGDWDAFAAVLGPIIQEEGVTASRPPDVMPVVGLLQ